MDEQTAGQMDARMVLVLAFTALSMFWAIKEWAKSSVL